MRLSFVLAAGFAFAACSSSTDTGGPVASARITPDDVVITAPTMLTGEGLDASGVVNSSAVVVWASLTPGIVSVDETGLVTPVSTGIGQVQITVDAFTAAATVRSIWNANSVADLGPLFPFTTTSGSRTLSSDVSQADADTRKIHADNVWTHLDGVLPNSGGPTVSLFFTNWRDVWTEVIPFCGGRDDESLDAISSCFNGPPRHYLVATADNGPTTKALAQQFLRFSYSEAEAFPWLKEGWSGWIAAGTFDATGNITISGPRQVVLDAFDAADTGGTLESLENLLQYPSADFYAGAPTRAPIDQMTAQAALFWGWLVTDNPDTAGVLFNEIRINGSTLTNASLLSTMFDDLGMDAPTAQAAYLAWARGL